MALSIKQINPIELANGTIMVIGLGDDSKIYLWDPKLGDWILSQAKPTEDPFPQTET